MLRILGADFMCNMILVSKSIIRVCSYPLTKPAVSPRIFSRTACCANIQCRFGGIRYSSPFRCAGHCSRS